jgi:plasmid stability protein
MNVLIRGLDEDTVKELEESAKENNRSLEEEVKAILDETAERSAGTGVNGARKAR